MKKFIGTVLLLSLIFIVVGCGNQASSGNDGNSGTSNGSGSSTNADEVVAEGEKNIAVVLKTLSSQYWRFVEAGAKDAGKDLGVNVTVLGPSSESQIMEQVNLIEDILNQNPDALVVSPTQPSTVVPALRGAANIPVLFIDTDADYDDKISFIGTDNYTAGIEAGKLLASKLNKGDKVALIGGALGNTAMDARIKGAKEVLEEAGIIIAAEQPADSDRTKAMSAMENILQNEPDIKGVFSANDDMAIGVARATEAKGLNIPIIGTDGTIEAIEAILDGRLTGTIAQSPYDMGYQGVLQALEVINGTTIEKRIDSGIDVLTIENAEEKLGFLKNILGE